MRFQWLYLMKYIKTMKMNENKLFATCPVCAYKLCKGLNGTRVDIVCPRCKNLIYIFIEHEKVKTEILEKRK